MDESEKKKKKKKLERKHFGFELLLMHLFIISVKSTYIGMPLVFSRPIIDTAILYIGCLSSILYFIVTLLSLIPFSIDYYHIDKGSSISEMSSTISTSGMCSSMKALWPIEIQLTSLLFMLAHTKTLLERNQSLNLCSKDVRLTSELCIASYHLLFGFFFYHKRYGLWILTNVKMFLNKRNKSSKFFRFCSIELNLNFRFHSNEISFFVFLIIVLF